jgi:hypothetical protein
MTANSLVAFALHSDEGDDQLRRGKSVPLKTSEWFKQWKERRSKALHRSFYAPWLPAATYEFDEIFFKKIFHRAEVVGYMKNRKRALHILAFRRFLMRFLFMADEHYETHRISIERAFSSNGLEDTTWLTFEDLHVACNGADGLKISVPLNPMERLNLVMEESKSKLGIAWDIIIIAAIFASVAATCDERAANFFGTTLLYIFTAEYVAKLVCAPYCRRSLLDLDNTITHVVPPHFDPNAQLPVLGSKTSRIVSFLRRPMNVIDFLSIAPFWAFLAETALGLPPVDLRFFRIFRIFRVLKFANYSDDLLMMGTVFSNSASSVAVIVFTLSLLSLVLGAIMFQLEGRGEPIPQDLQSGIWEGNEEWHQDVQSVPRAVGWVMGRLTNMQASLNNKYAIPADSINHLIVLAVGILKGFVFLLPLGQIQLLYREANAERKEQVNMQQEVEKYNLSFGHSWVGDMTLPYVYIELFSADSGDTKVGSTYLSLPIYTRKYVIAKTMCVLNRLDGKLKGPSIAEDTAIGVEVEWFPSDEDYGAPHGTLAINLLKGNNFPLKGSWSATFKVPVMLHGKDATQIWRTKQSARDPSGQPEWDDQQTFDIKWGGGRVEKEDFQIQLMRKLCLQMEHLERIVPSA